jgi:hypothetical protein
MRLLPIVLLIARASAHVQGMQTGVITGTVTSADGAIVPAAMVSVVSSALQGMKSAESDVNGVYVIRGRGVGTRDGVR